MRRSIGLGVAAAAVLAGCAEVVGAQGTSYVAQVSGRLADTGTFAAELAFVADYAEGTFTGEFRDFRFSLHGIDRPTGTVPLMGTLARNEESEFEMAGEGQGRLMQGDQELTVTMEIESYYIEGGRDTIQGGAWGGGDLELSGEYVDWLAMTASFTAEAVCKPLLLASQPCTMPPPTGGGSP